MNINVKALIVITAIAWIFFAVARPFVVELIGPENYVRRRNVWLVLTAFGFLLPSFWLYMLFAAALVFWAAKRDTNPVALYMLVLYALPPVEFQIPQFIGLNQSRLLAVMVLIPVAFKAMNQKETGPDNKLTWMDGFIILFGLWQLVLFIPYEAITNTIRRFSVYFLDTFILFFALARAGKSKADLLDIIVTFVLWCCLMSLLAGFEAARGWLLYQYVPEAWGQENPMAYLMRDGKLRAQVATGHALALGYFLALGFGLSLYVRNHLHSKRTRLLPLLFWIGLIGAYSRGPWIVAIIIFVSSFALQPGGFAKATKVVLLGAVAFGLVLLTPLGSSIIATLPFVGTIDQENVTYRQQLAEVSWRLIQENPWIGDPFFLGNMEELRQGQGIIDLMNGYASVALYSGVIGLVMYLGVFTVGAWKAFSTARRFSAIGDEFSYLGYCLVACMLGSFFYIATAGTGAGYYLLAGLLASYVRIGRHELSQASINRAGTPVNDPYPGRARSPRPHVMT